MPTGRPFARRRRRWSWRRRPRLLSIPVRTIHASMPPERRAELGITDGLIRISVGGEDVADLVESPEQAQAGA